MAVELPIILEALKGATPILLATLGAIIGQRAGVLNLGLEGVVYLSAAVAAATGPPWGYILAIAVGVIYNLLYYVLANDLALNQVLLGFAFTMIAYGIGSQAAKEIVGRPIEKPLVQGYEAYFIAGLVALAVYFLFRTRTGIVIKASGDDPASLDLMGVDVYRIRKLAGVLEGALASSAGAYLVLIYYGNWSEPLVMGWGTLAVITAMISLWNPLIAIIASLAPSLFITLSYTLQRYTQISPHLLNTIPYLASAIILIAVQMLMRKTRLKALAPKWLAKAYVREERM
ncbi:ABC transporter permease [Pyrobaculum aerophilum]|uniref:Sugar transport permease protein n=2 Tax=Pyrobaculum aerophilum TaxID=13773 RepID=Q8ZT68_PYRAE|nr:MULTISPECIES: ABC transporter permease [Pyrobaculum]AAL64895.1 sugar transport permease protein [Pyrobaculum aerophilum str. IM2]MCX8135444.1 ABC transporter permease [Pyrobaculum aerophilum]HII47495.1 ABC transporter permease [Pyrobaculum aerophilum]